MANDFGTFHDVSTGEVIYRELTDTEQITIDAMKEQETLNIASAEAKVIARAALLERLGITEEEAQLLLGGN